MPAPKKIWPRNPPPALTAYSMKLKLVASVKYFSAKHRDTLQYPYIQMPSHKRFGLETLLQPQLLMQVRLKLVVAVHTDEYFSEKQSHTLISIFPNAFP